MFIYDIRYLDSLEQILCFLLLGFWSIWVLLFIFFKSTRCTIFRRLLVSVVACYSISEGLCIYQWGIIFWFEIRLHSSSSDCFYSWSMIIASFAMLSACCLYSLDVIKNLWNHMGLCPAMFLFSPCRNLLFCVFIPHSAIEWFGVIVLTWIRCYTD